MTDGTYRWDPDVYTRNAEAQLSWARGLVSADDLCGDEAILDIGCGDGVVSAFLAGLVPCGSVTGIDSSQNMISRASDRFPSGTHPSLSFHLMDATKITFDSRFDIAFSNAALHWIKDQRAVLTGVRRALRAGGRFLAQMGGHGNAADIIRIVTDVTSRPKWREYFTDFDFPYCFPAPEYYTRLLLDTGFTPVSVKLVPKDMAKDGATGLVGWLESTWMPYLERLDPGDRPAFIEEVVSSYCEAWPPAEDGIVHVAMMRLEVDAVSE
jgi:trans-aconitate 2-methyltransferase